MLSSGIVEDAVVFAGGGADVGGMLILGKRRESNRIERE